MPSWSQDNKSLQDFIFEAKHWVTELEPKCLNSQLESPNPPLVLDVRDEEEFRQSHIEGAISLPRGFIELEARSKIPAHASKLVLYCTGGTRSLLAAMTLKEMGFTDLYSLSGGLKAWLKDKHPVSRPAILNSETCERYKRHLNLPEIGINGQTKLLASKVLIIGAGGLGSPCAYYLAAAGVGTIGIMDPDRVELSNLQRQILHGSDRIGMSKVESAAWTLRNYNPSIQLKPINKRLDADNAKALFSEYDVIIDGSDNIATRYVVNDACLSLEKPWIYGSVYRFEGHVSTFSGKKYAACYRCLYPIPPAPQFSPSCAEAGVLGVLPGIIGLLQTNEAVKLLLGLGKSLDGRLLTYNGLETSFKEFNLRKRSACICKH